MSEATIAAVVAEIAAYRRGERVGRLSWAVLKDFSGFSQVSLWAKPAIKEAFQAARRDARPDATPLVKAPRTINERIASAQASLAEMREIIRAYDELWVLYEYNMLRLGLDPEQLRRAIDPVNRVVLRTRQGRRLPR